jgi:protocatechuate 3,4-dioxygenase beta subunit
MYNAPNFSHPRDFRNPSFKVTAGADPVHLELKLMPGGKVSGHVMDAEGKPVPKAMIQIQGVAI